MTPTELNEAQLNNIAAAGTQTDKKTNNSQQSNSIPTTGEVENYYKPSADLIKALQERTSGSSKK